MISNSFILLYFQKKMFIHFFIVQLPSFYLILF